MSEQPPVDTTSETGPPNLTGLADPVLQGFSAPLKLEPENLLGLADTPGVHVVWDRTGRLLYVGATANTRTRLLQHRSGDRQASILHDKVGRLLEEQSGATPARDDIRAWLEECWFAVQYTADINGLKAEIMDHLDPLFNEVRPHTEPAGVTVPAEPEQDELPALLAETLRILRARRAGTADATAYRDLVENRIPNLIQPLLPEGFIAKGRIGVGDPSEVPWVGVFPAEKVSAKHGVYVVYLFAADGSGMYLSLNQGTEGVGGGTLVLTKRALDIRDTLPEQTDLLATIDLASKVDRPKRYTAGNAYALRYAETSMPTADELHRDLQRFVDLLKTVRTQITDFPVTETLHLVMKWNAELKPTTVQEHKAVADEQGAVWWGKFGKPSTPPISTARLETVRAQLGKTPVHCYLYRRGEVWRTQVKDLTLDASKIDRERLPAYYSPADCNLFILMSDFEQLSADYAAKNLLMASNPDPSGMAGALSNQTSPLLVFERGVPSSSSQPMLEPLVKPGASTPTPGLDMAWLAKQTLWTESDLQELLDALQDRGQIILAGPPGTGKTWLAKHVARYITQDDALAHRVLQFHPSYGYEEFIEGLRPQPEAEGLTFTRVDGAVLQMVRLIADSGDRNHVLILDEMNRANLPRVFGELMYALEYRDEPVNLLYSNDFELPRSLLFIGSMNTADRSIRSLDIALRRRFEVFECPPSADILTRYYTTHTNEVPALIEGFNELNERLTERLDRHHTVGHTFFMRDPMTLERLKATWKRQLRPLIEEYFFDQPSIAAEFSLSQFWSVDD